MATVCYTQATLTSAIVSTIFGEGATVENHVYTSAPKISVVPNTHLCPVVMGGRVCDPDSTIPGGVYTLPVTVHYQRTKYVTNFVTLYSTTCSVSQQPAPTPTPTPTPNTTPTTIPTTTLTTKSITVGSTTTQNSVFYPSQSLSTVDSSDTAVPNLGPGDTAATRRIPVGAIVGGVLGGLVAVGLLGFLIFKFGFNAVKGQDQGHRDHRRRRSQSQTAVDEPSPSEGSSGALHPQMLEYGAHANANGGQGFYNIAAAPGHQYTHVRQDSAGIGAAMGGVHFSPPVLGPEQGYRQSGYYLGHAEIQDSTI